VCVLPQYRIPKPDIPDPDVCVFLNTHIPGSGIFGLDILYTGKAHTYQDEEYLA
jgi:hypothetical protein